jgi:hypothetical protein
MTKTTETIRPGDVLRIEVGARNFGHFEVETIRINTTHSGRKVWTFDGYRNVRSGISGPYLISMVEGETVEVIA